MNATPLMLILLSALARPGAGADPGEPKATRTLDQVRDGLLEPHRRLRSVRLEYHARRPGASTGEGVRGIFAAKGRFRYSFQEHDWVGKSGADPASEAAFYDVASWNVYYPSIRRYEVSRRFTGEDFTLKIRGAAIFECLSWWPPDDDSAPPLFRDRPHFLKDVLAEPSCRLRPTQERLGDRPCHVIEVPGLDTLWVDAERGVLLRRDHFVGEPATLQARYLYGDHRPVADGISLPHTIHREYFIDPMVTDFEIVRYEANSVPDETFRFTPGPGTMVVDRDTDQWYQVPGGFEYFESLVQQIHADRPGRPRSAAAVDAGMAGLGMLLGLGAYGAGRTRRAGPARSGGP